MLGFSVLKIFLLMYKLVRVGDNESSTKEKRNTYPPLFDTMSVAMALRAGYFLRDSSYLKVWSDEPAWGCRTNNFLML